VQYVSPSNTIRIKRGIEYQRAEVVLIRLVGGDVPRPGEDHIHNFALLDNVVELRAPGEPRIPGGLTADELEVQLARWSAELRSCAPDSLAGDCSAIDEVEVLIRERMRQHPWPPQNLP
jgi:hypothetical protein